ncbi:hypothetical protein BU14_0107s0038 [Porphyra umbilicalis]|uniref:Uncharacterized protein n=1 Tax=Porphyra umbilicalis TaxID=2786 RepID=A0A1X6PCR3_PORUM|nr:hypothetical protein BU14_0107s0038 [Porphyra umbilicalis]|eukprot:OSX78530.1 hypothetical protein BU14_0107s0038 [Porphyra umbilicalis]
MAAAVPRARRGWSSAVVAARHTLPPRPVRPAAAPHPPSVASAQARRRRAPRRPRPRTTGSGQRRQASWARRVATCTKDVGVARWVSVVPQLWHVRKPPAPRGAPARCSAPSYR